MSIEQKIKAAADAIAALESVEHKTTVDQVNRLERELKDATEKRDEAVLKAKAAIEDLRTLMRSAQATGPVQYTEDVLGIPPYLRGASISGGVQQSVSAEPWANAAANYEEDRAAAIAEASKQLEPDMPWDEHASSKVRKDDPHG